MYLHGLGNSVVVLNDLKAVNELLDRKGAIYSHRPLFAVIGELVELDKVSCAYFGTVGLL